MNSSQSAPDFLEHLTGHLSELQTQIKKLAEQDIPAVTSNISKVINDNFQENPYQALLTAFGIGFGLAALQGHHLKQAALYLGKLAAFRALSEAGAQKDGAQNAA